MLGTIVTEQTTTGNEGTQKKRLGQLFLPFFCLFSSTGDDNWFSVYACVNARLFAPFIPSQWMMPYLDAQLFCSLLDVISLKRKNIGNFFGITKQKGTLILCKFSEKWIRKMEMLHLSSYNDLHAEKSVTPKRQIMLQWVSYIFFSPSSDQTNDVRIVICTWWHCCWVWSNRKR